MTGCSKDKLSEEDMRIRLYAEAMEEVFKRSNGGNDFL